MKLIRWRAHIQHEQKCANSQWNYKPEQAVNDNQANEYNITLSKHYKLWAEPLDSMSGSKHAIEITATTTALAPTIMQSIQTATTLCAVTLSWEKRIENQAETRSFIQQMQSNHQNSVLPNIRSNDCQKIRTQSRLCIESRVLPKLLS